MYKHSNLENWMNLMWYKLLFRLNLAEESACKDCGLGTSRPKKSAGSARCPDCWEDRCG